MSKPTKAQNPDMDFGFYATFPRIVRTGYKEVSAVQKWLYVCLKDLAGDDGTCYRTIRALVEETGLSAGMISESILVLHKAGLIHAEKKKRSTGGKEVWHISIVDIWKKNGEAHPTKRSPAEQNAPYIDVQSANVHHMNDNTTECSPAEHKRSPHEQECSLSETEVITITRPVSKNNTEARTEGTGNVASELPTPAPDQDVVIISGHDYKTPHLDTNCALWRAQNRGKTCQDYQLAIDAAYAPVHTSFKQMTAHMLSATLEQMGQVPQSTSQDEPYQRDFTASQSRVPTSQEKGESYGSDEHSDIPARDDYGNNHRSNSKHQQATPGDMHRTAQTQQQATIGEPHERRDNDNHSQSEHNRVDAAPGAQHTPIVAELSTLKGSSPQANAKVEPRPMSRSAHIDYTFQWLDAVRKRASGDPLASYVANGANKKRVADLIDACRGTANEVNEINVALAWMALWNAGQWSNGKSWQDPGMLTVKAFCEHYGESLDRARAKPQRKKPAADTPVNFTQLRLAAEAKARAQQGACHG